MDLILKLSRPEGYQASEGARFLVEFTKNRGVTGAAVTPFTAQLTTDGWTVEGEPSKADSVVIKLREYLQLAADAGDSPKSANSALSRLKVNRAEGLRAWAVLKASGELVKTDEGYSLTPSGSGGSGWFREPFSAAGTGSTVPDSSLGTGNRVRTA
jgi:hypothetical protein